MRADSLSCVLEATGYLPQGEPAPGIYFGDAIRQQRRRGRSFVPDAMWRSQSALTVYFKFQNTSPDDGVVSIWRREIWNEGFAPLLWVISPDRIELYNGFGRPLPASEDAAQRRIQTFRNIAAGLRELDAFAGRLAMETGQFWLNAPQVDRKTGVDQQLLSDLAYLERELIEAGLARPDAQALIGRAIFVKYLIDRRIVGAERLGLLTGYKDLLPVLRDRSATGRLFSRLERDSAPGSTTNRERHSWRSSASTARMPSRNRSVMGISSACAWDVR